MRCVLTGGEVADVSQATALVLGLRGRAVVGDRAYDSNAFLMAVEAEGMAAVIPPRANRKVRRALDTVAYTARNVIERFFGRVKAYRRVATRYDKTAASYVSLLALAVSLLELSGWTR